MDAANLAASLDYSASILEKSLTSSRLRIFVMKKQEASHPVSLSQSKYVVSRRLWYLKGEGKFAQVQDMVVACLNIEVVQLIGIKNNDGLTMSRLKSAEQSRWYMTTIASRLQRISKYS
jgi:hypothetical protein